MAATVFVVIVIQLCWTVAQSDTQPRDRHNASTKDFEVCQLRNDINGWEFILCKQVSVSSSFFDRTPVTDLWTPQCEVRDKNGIEVAVSGNPLENYRHDIDTVNISYANITQLDSSLFDQFSSLKRVYLFNNHLDDISELCSGLDYNRSGNSCGQLEMLRLDYNPLRIIKNDSFGLLEGLFLLSCDNCKLEVVEAGAFLSLENLEVLSLVDNRLKYLPLGLFQNNLKLEHLNISFNQLDAVPDVQTLTRLKYFDLSNNVITSVKKMDFFNCTELYLLDMSHNAINSIGEGAFDSIAELGFLELSNNRLQHLNEIFQQSKIEYLYLNNNQLTKFSIPKSLKIINLNNNSISSISFTNSYWIDTKSMLEVHLKHNNFSVVPLMPYNCDRGRIINPVYYFDGNPLQCSCESAWFFIASRTDEIERGLSCKPSAKGGGNRLYPEDDVLSTRQLCESSYGNSNRCLADHHDYTYIDGCPVTSIECQFQCPPPCYCYTTLDFAVVHLYCSKTQMKSIPHWFDNEKLSSESEVIIWLDGNNFNTINSTDFDIFINVVQLYLNHSHIHTIHQWAFHNLTMLRVLNLNDNVLQTLPIGLLDHLPNLQELYLANNALAHLADEMFIDLESLQILHLHKNHLSRFAVFNLKNLPTLKNVTLYGNEWSCDCSFINTFRDYLDHHGTTVHNAHLLICNAEDENLQKSIMQFDVSVCMSGDKATIWASIVSVCVILMLSVSLSFYYRRELQLLYYSRVRRRVLPNVNDSEGKVFDVFIAHSNDDSDFMYHNLLPRLEGIDNPYRVCVHERDFLASCVIAYNILEAVRVSSRTIILLTDNYVRSGWCRLAFKAAHLHMLADRCPRVLVIVVGRITAKLEPEMKIYLRTNTYLTWGEPYFWKKLYDAMPKQRATGVGVVTSPNLIRPAIESSI